jgi:hypothetical protein
MRSEGTKGLFFDQGANLSLADHSIHGVSEKRGSSAKTKSDIGKKRKPGKLERYGKISFFGPGLLRITRHMVVWGPSPPKNPSRSIEHRGLN